MFFKDVTNILHENKLIRKFTLIGVDYSILVSAKVTWRYPEYEQVEWLHAFLITKIT